MTLRWRKDKRETGLRAVGARPRGSKLFLDKADEEDYLATVNSHGGGWHGPVQGWYWVVPNNKEKGIEFFNSYPELLETEKEAKDIAKKYVVESMAAHKLNKGT